MKLQQRMAAAERWFSRWRDEANGGEVSGKFRRGLRRLAFLWWLRSEENAAAYGLITRLNAALARQALGDRNATAANTNVVSIAARRLRNQPSPAITPAAELASSAAPTTLESTPARAQLSRRTLFAGAAGLVVSGGLTFALTSVIRTRRDDLIASGHVVQVSLHEGLMHAARSTLYRLHPSEHAHTVHLLNGQAAFHVWHGARIATRVTTPLGEVFAVAARFSTLALDALLKVTVAEGSVRIIPSGLGASAVVLSAGQQLTLRRDDPAALIEPADAEREFAWLQGNLFINGESLAEVAATFNRFNELQIVPAPELADLTVTTHRCALNDPQRFVRRFAFERNLAWRQDGKLIRISRRAEPVGV